jgi:hypothetical protein
MSFDGKMGCCGYHLECQFKGECINPEYKNDCALYAGTISTQLKTLYELKRLGLVLTEDNHLTEKGIDAIKKQFGDVSQPYLLLMIIAVLGLYTDYRLHPKTLKKVLFQFKKWFTPSDS